MRGKVTLLAVVAAAIMLAAVSFSVYQQATAENAADPQLRASARLLLPQLSQDRIWSGRARNNALQAMLDRYADQLLSRKQFAVVCWYSPEMRQLAPHCVHATHSPADLLAIDASQLQPNQVTTSTYGSVSFRGYSTAFDLPRSARHIAISGVLYIFQAVD